MIVHITTKQSHYNVYTIIILLFLWAYVVGSIARPVDRGFGPGLGLKYEIVLWAGAGHIFLLAGPGLIIQFAGRARAGCAQLLRALCYSKLHYLAVLRISIRKSVMDLPTS